MGAKRRGLEVLPNKTAHHWYHRLGHSSVETGMGIGKAVRGMRKKDVEVEPKRKRDDGRYGIGGYGARVVEFEETR